MMMTARNKWVVSGKIWGQKNASALFRWCFCQLQLVSGDGSNENVEEDESCKRRECVRGVDTMTEKCGSALTIQILRSQIL